ncbi:MAG: hypothetical protein SFU99_05965 [Saprospiraceae bacterium]|nr:hypothetical protein [Saprospiraceae bacterium]
MKTYQLLIFLILGSFALSCDQTAKQQAQEQQLWDQVMAVHDEVMPKMGEMNQLSRDLRTKLEELDTTLTEQREQMMMGIRALEQADEGMMSWMSAIEPLDELHENKTHEEIMAYLKEEQQKVSKVKEDMLKSIEEGKKLLNNGM